MRIVIGLRLMLHVVIINVGSNKNIIVCVSWGSFPDSVFRLNESSAVPCSFSFRRFSLWAFLNCCLFFGPRNRRIIFWLSLLRTEKIRALLARSIRYKFICPTSFAIIRVVATSPDWPSPVSLWTALGWTASDRTTLLDRFIELLQITCLE